MRLSHLSFVNTMNTILKRRKRYYPTHLVYGVSLVYVYVLNTQV